MKTCAQDIRQKFNAETSSKGRRLLRSAGILSPPGPRCPPLPPGTAGQVQARLLARQECPPAHAHMRKQKTKQKSIRNATKVQRCSAAYDRGRQAATASYGASGSTATHPAHRQRWERRRFMGDDLRLPLAFLSRHRHVGKSLSPPVAPRRHRPSDRSQLA